MNDRSSLNWKVLDLLQDLIAERGITKSELVQHLSMGRNTFFAKMRGETALTTDDIADIADALGADPEMILRKAWEGRMSNKPNNVIVGRFGDTEHPAPENMVAYEEDGDTGEDLE